MERSVWKQQEDISVIKVRFSVPSGCLGGVNDVWT